MRAERAGHGHRRLAGLGIERRRGDLRPTRLGIESGRPGDGAERRARQKLAGLAVEDIEIAVLRRLHQHLAHAAVDRQVGEDDVLGCVEVPHVARHLLEMPGIFAGVDVHGDDRIDEQIVALALAAQVGVPGDAVADAEIEQLELGVVGHVVPDRAAAALLPPLAVPGLGGHLHGLVLEALLGVAGHGVETPDQLSRVGVVRRDVAARVVLGAGIADQNLAVDDARCAGDGIVLGRVRGLDLPDDLAGLGVERDEAAVEHADIDLAFPRSDAAVDHIAAGASGDAAIDLGVVFPKLLAGLGVERDHVAPRRAGVHDAIDDERRRLEAARRARLDVVVPSEAELADVAGVDLRQRAVALLVIGPTDREPVPGLFVGVEDALGVDVGGIEAAGCHQTKRER